MTLSVIASVALGFVAAQAGAMIQFRRDQRSQRQRDQMEVQRLQKQLDAEADRLQLQVESEDRRLRRQLEQHSTEAVATRQLQDLMDWRERRITAYRNVSTAAILMEQTVNNLTQSVATFFASPEPTGQETDTALQGLRSALDEADLMSDEPLRDVGAELWQIANNCLSAAREVVRTTKSRQSALEDERNGIQRPDNEFSAFFHPSVKESTERIERANHSWNEIWPGFAEARSRWTAEARLRLGVPS